MGDHAVGHALFAYQVRNFARINTAQTDNAAHFEPCIKMLAGAIIGRLRYGRLHNAAFDSRTGRKINCFTIIIIGAHIADMREREGHNLACIRRIGENFLITRHRCVEAHFRNSFALSAKSHTFNHRAISQNQNGCNFRLLPIAKVGAWFCFGLGCGCHNF